MDYPELIQKLATDHPGLAAELSAFRSLESVMGWMKRRDLALADVDIIQQDEFSLDFVIPLRAEKRYLVFGIS